MRKHKQLWIAAGAIIAIALSGLGYILSGSVAVESWVGTQLLAIGGSYLEPELKFKKLTYVRPRTILLDGLTLTSPDPTDPKRGVVILGVKHARLELTEIPRRGQPLHFSEIILESPEFRAVMTPGGLLGFSHFVKDPGEPVKPEAQALAEPLKLSDFLSIRQIELINGVVSFDSRRAGMPPLWLDGINARLKFSPAEASPRPGLYTIATTISRAPAIELTLQGQLDIDTLTLELAKLELMVDLQEKNIHFLPSEIQNALKTFEVTGQLNIAVAGILPLADSRQARLQSKANLTAARLAVGENRIAIESWNWVVDIARGVATIHKADAKLLSGNMQLTGKIPLDTMLPAQLELHAQHLQIQQLQRSSQSGEPPEFAGNIMASVLFQAPLAAWNKRARGGGDLSIRQGRIDNIPGLGRIVTSINNNLARALGGNGRALNDSVDATFSFVDDHVVIHHFTGSSGALALRGNGTVGFDQQLDLRLNAGPMERMQNSLGAVGRLWGSVSDSMAGYRVTGQLNDPQVSMEIGGH